MTDTIKMQLTGLSCGSCVGRTERACKPFLACRDVAVNLASESAVVSFDAPADTSQLTAALSEAGYPATQDQVTLDISNMSCASCVGRVEEHYRMLRAYLMCQSILRRNPRLSHSCKERQRRKSWRGVATQAGYPAKPRAQTTERENTKAAEADTLWRRFLVAGLLTLPVFLMEMGSHFVPGVHHLIAQTIGTQTSWIIQFVLVTAVLAGPGRIFFARGIPSLLKGTPDMNALVAIGTAAAWAFSTIATFVPSAAIRYPRVYFEAAAVIVTLILLGRWLEARAKGRTGDAIRKLVGLQPKSALVEIDGDTREFQLPKSRSDRSSWSGRGTRGTG